ncbi:AraC family transcriptional regulator ligand-binding domain-containing protein [Solimonas sp. K1W22B-7]|uniref:AraC family transcriptional regulator ligand-binding domain-containing protein n=1 Tax=Solimonas sp. K1W22B-7 TaxID=2303331 RepID=UPI0013C4A35C|nr:AraC family transcriptional regulator ligand-binding domain-containing protein [Solimonas sp. K1W22B-7]
MGGTLFCRQRSLRLRIFIQPSSTHKDCSRPVAQKQGQQRPVKGLCRPICEAASPQSQRLVCAYLSTGRDFSDRRARTGAESRQQYPAAPYRLLSYVAMSCATFGDAIEQMQRYLRLAGDISSTRLVTRGRSVDVIWQWSHGSPVPDSMPKLQQASRITLARWITDRRGAGVTAYVQFPRPRDDEVYDRFFGGRTRFGQRDTKLEFPADFLRMPVATANPCPIGRLSLCMQTHG